MEKKPLIGGCILAVVLLVLGSLSTVAGYQSVKPTVNNSPLFQTRTQRATNQQQNELKSQYLGKGKDSIPFSFLDNKISMLQKLINQIRNMNDNTLSRYVKYAICLLTQRGTVKYSDTKDIENRFYKLRKNSGVYDDYINPDIGNFTWRVTPSICWFPGCFLLFISVIFLMTIAFHCFPTEKICNLS